MCDVISELRFIMMFTCKEPKAVFWPFAKDAEKGRGVKVARSSAPNFPSQPSHVTRQASFNIGLHARGKSPVSTVCDNLCCSLRTVGIARGGMRRAVMARV